MTATNDIDWLRQFFGEGNAWSLERIENSDYPGTLQRHLETMLRPCLYGSLPYVLPRVDSNKALFFYIVGESTRQISEFRRVLEAFLGRVNTILDPCIHLASDDEIEKSLLKEFSHGFLKLLVPSPVSANKPETYTIFKTLNLAVEQYAQRPPGLADIHRPIGRILSDFFVACDRDDGSAALEYFRELGATDRLSPRNLISLELQALAAHSDWDGLLGHPRLSDILSGRIPGSIEKIVLDAIGHSILTSDNIQELDIDNVRQSIERFGSLFLSEPDLLKKRHTRSWRTWSIGAAALGNIRVQGDTALKALGKDWIDGITDWAQLAPPAEPEANRLAGALRAKPSFEAALTLLQQSLAGSHKEGLEIYKRISEYPAATLEQIHAHRTLNGVWRNLNAEYSSPADTGSWSRWLNSLIRDPENTIPIDLISESCKYWESDVWDEQEVTSRLYELADTDRVSFVREVVPILRGWLRDNQVTVSAPFIEALAVVLSSDEVYSVQDLAIYSDLIDDLTDISHAESQYADLVHAARHCWERVQSVNSIELALEIMDVLLDNVCASDQARLEFWMALQKFCIANWSRVPRSQQLIILQSAKDATTSTDQLPPIAEERSAGIGQLPDLSNKQLAIYTLTEGAARRAGAAVKQLFPQLEIKLNHDKSATAALVNLAKTADYFVFVSRSAAHQAFYPVTKERDDILYPAGKGSSSIVRCFLDAIQNQPN